jgi:hypothetical protein
MIGVQLGSKPPTVPGSGSVGCTSLLRAARLGPMQKHHASENITSNTTTLPAAPMPALKATVSVIGSFLGVAVEVAEAPEVAVE